jgi:hypothetical protein
VKKMNRDERRKEKGNPVGYVLDGNIQGEGESRMKPIREHVLEDVVRLNNQGSSRREIHDFLLEEYGYREDNHAEIRYLNYIKEKNL